MPGGRDDRLDLGAGRAGADRERHPSGGVAHRLAHVLVHGGAVADRCAVALDALGDHRVDVGMVVAEPRADDLRVGEARELVVVLAAAESGLPCSAKSCRKISQRIGSSSESVPLKSKMIARTGIGWAA